MPKAQASCVWRRAILMVVALIAMTPLGASAYPPPDVDWPPPSRAPAPPAPIPEAIATIPLRLRTGPGTAFSIQRLLDPGEAAIIVGKTQAGDWFQVRPASGGEGWVMAQWVTVTGPVDTIAVVDAALQTAQALPPPAPAAPPIAPRVGGSIIAIGDSVMLGAEGALRRTLGNIYLDATVSRQASHTVNLLWARRNAGTLGSVVIIHVGNNGTFTAAQFDEMMRALAGVPQVIFITVKVPRSWQDSNNWMLRTKAQQYPNVRLVDWYGASINSPGFFATDGYHIGGEGARVYANLIAASLY